MPILSTVQLLKVNSKTYTKGICPALHKPLKMSMIQTNLFTKLKQTHRLRKQTDGYQKGKARGRILTYPYYI